MWKPVILLLDDNEAFLEMFAPLLSEAVDCRVAPLTTADSALDLLESEPVDLVISDIQMPGMTGLELFGKMQDSHPDVPVIFITAFGSTEQAIQAIRRGAFHYFEKPFIDKLELFLATVREALIKRRMLMDLASTRKGTLPLGGCAPSIIGESPAMKKVFHSIREAAEVPVTVLVTGETGTGEDLVARAIHELSERRDKGFYAVNCAEFAEGVLESELFGHEKGSFTGAMFRRKGVFEIADQGTIFLDEISEASFALQTKLLRVLESRTFTRVGGSTAITSDFRIIAATNRDLKERVASSYFRSDLLYRLNVYAINVAPLRERVEDIPLLVDYYVSKFRNAYKRSIQGISGEAMLFLMSYHWPGNVRELVNVVEKAVITCRNSLITLRHLPLRPDANGDDEWTGFDLNLRKAEKLIIEMALKRTEGNKLKAADILGINRRTLAEKLKHYSIDENPAASV